VSLLHRCPATSHTFGKKPIFKTPMEISYVYSLQAAIDSIRHGELHKCFQSAQI
jgi:hypothetical protein